MSSESTFRHRLARARQEAGLSQDGLAQLIGVAKSQISEYERSDRTPRPQRVAALATALNVDRAWLATGAESEVEFLSFADWEPGAQLTEINQQVGDLAERSGEAIASIEAKLDALIAHLGVEVPLREESSTVRGAQAATRAAKAGRPPLREVPAPSQPKRSAQPE